MLELEQNANTDDQDSEVEECVDQLKPVDTVRLQLDAGRRQCSVWRRLIDDDVIVLFCPSLALASHRAFTAAKLLTDVPDVFN